MSDGLTRYSLYAPYGPQVDKAGAWVRAEEAEARIKELEARPDEEAAIRADERARTKARIAVRYNRELHPNHPWNRALKAVLTAMEQDEAGKGER